MLVGDGEQENAFMEEKDGREKPRERRNSETNTAYKRRPSYISLKKDSNVRAGSIESSSILEKLGLYAAALTCIYTLHGMYCSKGNPKL